MKDLALMLSKIGLTNAEAKAYLALLDLGQSTVGPIAKRANVSYSKIHALLEKLVDKGLASYSLKERTKFFSPSNPKKIIDFLERKRISKKIHYRLIYNESLRDDAEVKEWKKLPLTEIRFLLDDTPASINVAADRTMIIYWHQEKPKVFFIKSKPVAGSFRKYFEVIWEKARE